MADVSLNDWWDPNARRVDPSSKELRSIEFLAALDSVMDRSHGYLEERLRSVPDLYRQYRVATVALSKVVEGLYDTLPANILLRLKRVGEQSELVLRPVRSSNDTHIVLESDLLALVNTCKNAECSMCIKTDKEVKQCQLRRALMNIIPLEEPNKGTMCGYTREFV